MDRYETVARELIHLGVRRKGTDWAPGAFPWWGDATRFRPPWLGEISLYTYIRSHHPDDRGGNGVLEELFSDYTGQRWLLWDDGRRVQAIPARRYREGLGGHAVTDLQARLYRALKGYRANLPYWAVHVILDEILEGTTL